MKKLGWAVAVAFFAVLIGMSQGWAATKDLLVIKGEYDRIENVLTALGFAERMDVVPDDEAIKTMNFSNYKALFINCDYDGITDKPDQALLNKVRDYVHGGGMLYVTDDAANFLQSWDTEIGYSIIYDSDSFHSGNWETVVADAALKAKFSSDRFDASGNIIIHHTYDNGEPIVNSGSASVLLKNAANVSNTEATANQVQAIDFRPSKGGRVVYTTFHNHPEDVAPVPADGDDYIAYQNVLTVMRYICGSLGTATEQDVLLDRLGAGVSDLVGNPQGGPFSDLADAGWSFQVENQTPLTFAVYAATVASSGSAVHVAAATDPIFTLTAPDGHTHRAQGNPAAAPVVFHVTGQSGLWKLQCTENASVVSASRSTTGMVLAGTFGTASSEPGGTTVVPTKIDFTVSGTQIEVGKSKTVLVTFTPSNTTERNLVWKVGNDLIAKVEKSGTDTYKVTGLLKGSTYLTATSAADSNVSKTVAITVVGDGSSPNGSKKDDSGGGGCDGLGLGVLALFALAGMVLRKR